MEIQSITNVVSIHKSIISLTHLIDHSYCQAWSALLAAAILKMHLYFYIATDPTSCDVTIQDGGGVTRCRQLPTLVDNRQSSGSSQLQARDGVTIFFSDFKILWLWLLMIDPMFGIQQYDTFTVFLLKIMWYGCPTWKCRSISWRKRLPILVATFLSNGGLNHMMFLFRWRFRLALWDDCNCEGVV